MGTVLMQECQRYNNLIAVFNRSLADVLKALKGLVVMSSDLESMAESLYTNQVPAMWVKQAYPSLSTTGHSTNFVLPVELPSLEPCSGLFSKYVETFSGHWIKRAVALFCALNY